MAQRASGQPALGRALPGLVQKYYMRFSDTGQHGAVYVWASEEALARFRASDLARTISRSQRRAIRVCSNDFSRFARRP
jgi:heme-degrading monooxygenase HmoA